MGGGKVRVGWRDRGIERGREGRERGRGDGRREIEGEMMEG